VESFHLPFATDPGLLTLLEVTNALGAGEAPVSHENTAVSGNVSVSRYGGASGWLQGSGSGGTSETAALEGGLTPAMQSPLCFSSQQNWQVTHLQKRLPHGCRRVLGLFNV
jgi:hypothetical protein